MTFSRNVQNEEAEIQSVANIQQTVRKYIDEEMKRKKDLEKQVEIIKENLKNAELKIKQKIEDAQNVSDIFKVCFYRVK